MVNSLAAFMAQNALKEENTKVVVSKRFVDKEGNPMEWELRALTSEEDEMLRKSCTKKVQVPGKRERFTMELDSNRYIGLIAVQSTVYPDLNNASLQDSYSVMEPDKLLKKMLLPGEYAEFIQKVQEVNGFDYTMDERVEDAKN